MFLKVSLPMLMGLALATTPAAAAERDAPSGPGSIPAFTKTVKCAGAVNAGGQAASALNGDLRSVETKLVGLGQYDVAFKPVKCGTTTGSVQARDGYIRIVQPDLLTIPGAPPNNFLPSTCSVMDSPTGPNVVRVNCYWWNNPAGNFFFRNTAFTILLMK